jgi:hypothetical protein
MKKLKTMFCILVLSISFTGNTFASDTVGTGITGIFDKIVTAIMSVVATPADCPLRDCSNCKPSDRGDCRPTEN